MLESSDVAEVFVERTASAPDATWDLPSVRSTIGVQKEAMMSTTRVQPVLSPAELELVDHVAALTQAKRTDVIKNALTVYHWFVRQAVTGGRVVARKATGEEVTLETPELAALDGRANRLSPEELGRLAEQLAAAPDPTEAGRLRERLARGFYGI